MNSLPFDFYKEEVSTMSRSTDMGIILWNFTLEGEVGKGKLCSKDLNASHFLFYGRIYFPKVAYVEKRKMPF